MRSPTKPGPLVHVFVSLATVALAFLIFAGGPEGFKHFLIIGVPSILGLMVLVYLVRRIRKVFSKPEAPFISSARGLRLQTTTSRPSPKLGRWTVMEVEAKTDEPFSPKK